MEKKATDFKKHTVDQVKLPFTKILTTADKYRTETNLIIITNESKDMIDDVQEVVAVGSQVIDPIKKGSKVRINYTRFAQLVNKDYHDKIQEKTVLRLPILEIGGKEYLYLDDRDIYYVID